MRGRHELSKHDKSDSIVKMSRYDMTSLPEEQLREIVRLSMESEPVDRMQMMMSEKMTKNRWMGLIYTSGTV